jgi:hypothetical protein
VGSEAEGGTVCKEMRERGGFSEGVAADVRDLADEAVNDPDREAWLEAYEDQFTPEVVDRVRRYAAKRAKLVGDAGGIVGELYERELVQNALADTYTGALKWDPAAESLESHLMDAVQWRARDDWRSATSFLHVSLDAAASPAERERLLAPLEEAKADGEHPLYEERWAKRAAREVRRLARTDPMVRTILRAFAKGATKRADMLVMTKMSADEYHLARRRMARAARAARGARTKEAAI